MTESMIDRAAKAMAERREELIAQPLARVYPDLVRAVLNTLMEPDEGMVEAGCHGATTNANKTEVGNSWRAMISHILKESESK